MSLLIYLLLSLCISFKMLFPISSVSGVKNFRMSSHILDLLNIGKLWFQFLFTNTFLAFIKFWSWQLTGRLAFKKWINFQLSPHKLTWLDLAIALHYSPPASSSQNWLEHTRVVPESNMGFVRAIKILRSEYIKSIWIIYFP